MSRPTLHTQDEFFPDDPNRPGLGSILVGEQAGDWVGPYRLVRHIGEGGFGVVWLAERLTPMRQRVALKIMKPGMDSVAVLARFRQERQALAVMDHPSIAQIYDAGSTAAGRPFFAMELVRGEPITRYCDTNRLSIRRRLELFISVCDAIQHAHHKGVIHRDIKPENVLVSSLTSGPEPASHAPDTADSQEPRQTQTQTQTQTQPQPRPHPDAAPTFATIVKVIDFGVAKAVGREFAHQTVFADTGHLVGTFEYMSPEQADMSADVDTRTDVYSLGVLLYELLTGSTPFDRINLRSRAFDEIRRIIREVDAPRPSTHVSGLRVPARRAAIEIIAQKRDARLSQLRDELRSEIEWVALKSLRKDRAERYNSPHELATDVRNYLDGRPLIAGPTTGLYLARKFVLRHRAAVAAAITIFLTLLAGIIGTTLTARWALREAYLANIRAGENALRLADMPSLRASLQACSPSSRGIEWRILATLADESNGRRTCSSSSVKSIITLQGGRALSVSSTFVTEWSAADPRRPDGWNMLASRSVSVKEKGYQPIAQILNSTPDGRVLIAERNGFGTGVEAVTFLYSLEHGREIATLSTGTQFLADPRRKVALSPDSKLVALAMPAKAGQPAATLVFQASTGERVASLPAAEALAFTHDSRALLIADRGLREYDLNTAQSRVIIQNGSLTGLKQLIASPSGTLIATLTADAVEIWDRTTGERLSMTPARATAVAFAHDPSAFFLSAGNLVRLIAVRSGEVLHTFRAHTATITSLTLTPDGSTLYSGDAAGNIFAWNAAPPLTPKPRFLAATPDASCILLEYTPPSAADPTLALFSAATGDTLLTLPGRALAAAINHDATRCVMISVDRQVTLWDLTASQGQPGYQLAQPRTIAPFLDPDEVLDPHSVIGVARFSPDGDRLLVGVGDQFGKGRWAMINTRDAALVAVAKPRAGILTAAFSPRGDRVVVAAGATTTTYDRDLKEQATGTTDGGPMSLAFRDDGRRIAAGIATGTILILDAASLTTLAKLPLELGSVRSIHWHGDDRILATGDRGQTKIIDPHAPNPILTIQFTEQPLCFLLDRRSGRVVVPSSTGLLRSWSLSEDLPPLPAK